MSAYDEYEKRLALWATTGPHRMREGWFTHREISALVAAARERDAALALAERRAGEVARLKAVEVAARKIVAWDDENHWSEDGIPWYWDDMETLRAALAAAPPPDATPA